MGVNMGTYFIYIVICLFGIDHIGAIHWSNCGKSGKLINVSVTNCETTDICILTKKSNVSFTVIFSPEQDTPAAQAVVHGIIGGVPVPFKLDNPDACVNCGLVCPLKAGNVYNYTKSIYINAVYPSIKLDVKWELKNPSGDDVFCIIVPVRIQSAKLKFIPFRILKKTE